MRVLLVEDDALLGDGLHAGLRQAAFDVNWVRDGVAAQLAIETSPYAAVVLDLGLPRLDGAELLRRLRAAGNKVPVLVLTARDAIADRVRGLDGGADDYVVKPVTCWSWRHACAPWCGEPRVKPNRRCGRANCGSTRPHGGWNSAADRSNSRHASSICCTS